jgi:hypothetical protein
MKPFGLLFLIFLFISSYLFSQKPSISLWVDQTEGDPGDQITKRQTPNLYQAALTSLDLHGDGTTSCSRAWYMNCKARFYQPEKAFDYFYGIPASLDMDPYVYIENDHFTGPAIKDQDWVKGVRKGPAMKGFDLLGVLPVITDKTELCKYDDFCTQVDNTVGRVLKVLDEKGLAGNTIVIFTANNGYSPAAGIKNLEANGHYPSYVFRGYKSDIFEGGHRIPFLVRWPGKIKPARVSDETICLTDLMATSAALIGYELKPDKGEDSYYILPVLLGENYKKPLREATVHHSHYGSFSIRQGKWKFEDCPGSGGWGYPRNKNAEEMGLPSVQLYDLENDIAETKNVYREYPGVVKELKEL